VIAFPTREHVTPVYGHAAHGNCIRTLCLYLFITNNRN
jgi:hypothetical protein